MSIDANYCLKLTFTGPVLSQAPGVLRFGVDTAMQRYLNLPVLNGSLVRGNIRHALKRFADLYPNQRLPKLNTGKGKKERQKTSNDQRTELERWFGALSDGDSEYHERAQVDFDFFWRLTDESKETFFPSIETPPEHTAKSSEAAEAESTNDNPFNVVTTQRTRIAIEAESGKVVPGALQVIEDCFPSGSTVTFEGRIHLRAANNADKKAFEYWLGKALAFIPAMGSFKGTGFGRLQAWALSEPEAEADEAFVPYEHVNLQSHPRLSLLLYLDRPFCIGRPRTSDSNRIVSDELISGNVIKGVLARAIEQELARTPKQYELKRKKKSYLLDQLRVSHALPCPVRADAHVNGYQRRSALPLSLGFFDHRLFDFANISLEDFLSSVGAKQSSQWEAPKFNSDWKTADDEKANDFWGVEASPDRYLSIRTGINSTQRVSEEGQLFSMECVVPEGFVWSVDIDFSAIDANERQFAFDALETILAKGLSGIGKTKARAHAVWVQGSAQAACSTPSCLGKLIGKPQYNDHYIVTLQSDARLLPPNLCVSGVNSQTELERYYHDYWNQQSTDLELIRYYAQQRLEGLYYHQVRHQGREQENVAYYPEWLTCTGSVFVLKAKSDDAKRLLTQWQHSGLPAHVNSHINNSDIQGQDSKPDWTSTPFLPENGYGEVRINDPKQVNALYDSQGANVGQAEGVE